MRPKILLSCFWRGSSAYSTPRFPRRMFPSADNLVPRGGLDVRLRTLGIAAWTLQAALGIGVGRWSSTVPSAAASDQDTRPATDNPVEPIPEPGLLLLIGSGVGAAVLARRTRSK